MTKILRINEFFNKKNEYKIIINSFDVFDDKIHDNQNSALLKISKSVNHEITIDEFAKMMNDLEGSTYTSGWIRSAHTFGFEQEIEEIDDKFLWMIAFHHDGEPLVQVYFYIIDTNGRKIELTNKNNEMLQDVFHDKISFE